MDEEIKEMHLRAIKKQFEAAGFAADSIKKFLEEFSPETGARATWAFETHIYETKVKGKVYAEPNVPGGMYALDFYQLTLARRPTHENHAYRIMATNKFVCTPWSWIKLDEAVNLMQGRYVYRKPDADPTGEGYWMYLNGKELIKGVCALDFIRTGFDVGNYLAETGLGGWLGLNGWVRLVDNLEKGARCDLVIGTGAGMRSLVVEADPRNGRLALFDLAGHELELEKVMSRKHVPNHNPGPAPRPDPIRQTPHAHARTHSRHAN